MDEQDRVVIDSDDNGIEAAGEVHKTVRILSFWLGKERYGIEITHAKEAFKISSCTKVPNTPSFVVGVTNIHGEVVPLIDIRYFLGASPKEGLGSSSAIISDVGSNPIGIVVDGVSEALDIEELAIQPPLATIKGKVAEFTKGQVELGGDIMVLLELRKILSCDEIESLKKG